MKEQEGGDIAIFGSGTIVQQFTKLLQITDGFYYDMWLEKALTPEDLVKIEKEMAKIASSSFAFEKSEMKAQEAIDFFKQKIVSK